MEPYVQESAVINGRHIFHYLITVPDFCNIHIIQHEDRGFGLVCDAITDDNDKAERLFKRLVAKIVNGCPD